MDLRIIYDPNNEASRNFAETNPSVPLIDWYGDLEGRLTLIAKGVTVSDFPTVVDMQSGKTCTAPASMDAASAEIAEALRPKTLLKLSIVDRLQAAGKFNAAMSALSQDAYTLERWRSAIEINKDDQQVRALLTAVGADADSIMA